MPGPSLYPNIKRSTSGYRINSDDKNEEKLIIPGDENGTKISMKEENGDPLEKGYIKGTGLQTGKIIIMEPGEEHTFAGDKEVLEEPIKT